MQPYFRAEAFASTLFTSIGSVAFKPKVFFQGLETTDSYRNSIIFLLLIFFIPSLIDSYQISQEKMISILPAMEGAGLLLVWLWAGYLYWSVHLFTNYELDHASAFQLAAYSSVPVLLDFSWFLIVPAIIWQFIISWMGLVHHAGIERGNATAIMIVPVVLLIAAFVAFIMLMALMGLDLVSPFLNKN